MAAVPLMACALESINVLENAPRPAPPVLKIERVIEAETKHALEQQVTAYFDDIYQRSRPLIERWIRKRASGKIDFLLTGRTSESIDKWQLRLTGESTVYKRRMLAELKHILLEVASEMPKPSFAGDLPFEQNWSVGWDEGGDFSFVGPAGALTPSVPITQPAPNRR